MLVIPGHPIDVDHVGPRGGPWDVLEGDERVGRLFSELLRLGGANFTVLDLRDRLYRLDTMRPDAVVQGAPETLAEAARRWWHGRGPGQIPQAGSQESPYRLFSPTEVLWATAVQDGAGFVIHDQTSGERCLLQPGEGGEFEAWDLLGAAGAALGRLDLRSGADGQERRVVRLDFPGPPAEPLQVFLYWLVLTDARRHRAPVPYFGRGPEERRRWVR